MSNQIYADYIDLYSDKTQQYNQWLGDSSNIHWSQYVDSNSDLGPAWVAETASSGPYPGMSKWDWGYQHYQKNGKTETRIIPKVVNTNGMKNEPGAGGRSDYTTIAVSQVNGTPQSDANVKSQFGYDKWERTQYDGSGKSYKADKTSSRILPGTKFSIDSSGNLKVLSAAGGIQTIGDEAQTTYNDLATKINKAKPEDYKALMENVDNSLDSTQFADLTNSANYASSFNYAGGLSLLSEALKTKIGIWDPSKQGANPPVGAFDPSYYTTQTESGKTAQKEWDSYLGSVKVGGFTFNNETYTKQYQSPEGYAQWHYTTQGLPAGERGNAAENAKAVTEYQEYLTDAERQTYRDQVLGLAPTFDTIQEWAAAQDLDVLETWYDLLPIEQKKAYDEGTLPVPTLDYIPDSIRADVVMTKGLTTLEGELSTVITAKDIQQQAMFGSLTQDSLKRSVDELNRLTREQQEFDFYMGLEGFEEIATLNEELSNSLLGDSGIGGILAWMGDPEEISGSLEDQLANITGVPSRNSTVYNWQKWFEEQLLPVYKSGTTVTDAFDPNVTYEIPPEFAKDYIDRYLRPRFDESKSMSEFISYMDVKQEEQNIFQTQSALSKLKDLADLRAKSYLDQIYTTTNPSAGGVALVFDPKFYWDPTGNFDVTDPKHARYQLQKETVAKDWEIARNEGSTAKPDGEPYTWDQLAYLYGLDLNNADQFAKLHYQVKGYKEKYNFDPAKDVITLNDAEDYIKNVIIPEVEAEKVELGDISFLNFVTPAEFADAMLEGISPEENREEWEKLLESIGLSEEDLGVEEVKEYIIEALSTGEALEIREAIKYLNEKKIKPTQEELGVTYIERDEDYQPTESPTDTQLYKIFQSAGYQGTEDDFYRDFMPDVNRSEMELLAQGQGGLETSSTFSGLMSNDPFEALVSLEALFAEDEEQVAETPTKEKKPSYFTLFEEEEESPFSTGDDILGEFTSLFKGL
jgi:hypothetical protein